MEIVVVYEDSNKKPSKFNIETSEDLIIKDSAKYLNLPVDFFEGYDFVLIQNDTYLVKKGLVDG